MTDDKLLTFARTALGILTRDEEWDADTADDIGRAATELGLGDSKGPRGLFQSPPQTKLEKAIAIAKDLSANGNPVDRTQHVFNTGPDKFVIANHILPQPRFATYRLGRLHDCPIGRTALLQMARNAD